MKTVSGEDSGLIQTHPLRLLGQQPRVKVVGHRGRAGYRADPGQPG
ncbi:MAG: hypothetical protein PHW25_03685 [Zoogloea sp.]|jgi:hypothetical protein|nr:hypothetical protein [Zoogloea sp.]MDD3326169.1 hypothetical protein [Zoogloea sp.]